MKSHVTNAMNLRARVSARSNVRSNVPSKDQSNVHHRHRRQSGIQNQRTHQRQSAMLSVHLKDLIRVVAADRITINLSTARR